MLFRLIKKIYNFLYFIQNEIINLFFYKKIKSYHLKNKDYISVYSLFINIIFLKTPYFHFVLFFKIKKLMKNNQQLIKTNKKK